MDQMRLPQTPPEPGAICSWLACGPFPPLDPSAPLWPAPTNDYLAAAGGEANVAPTAGAAVRRADGTVVTWRSYQAADGAVDVCDIAGRLSAPSTVYFAAILHEPQARKATFHLIGREHHIKVYLNGQPVQIPGDLKNYRTTGIMTPVSLKQGDNVLVVRAYGFRQERRFTCRMVDAALASLPETPALRGELLPSPGGKGLRIQTDAWQDPRGQRATVEVFGPCGKVMVAPHEVLRGATFECDTVRWPEGPYEVRLSALNEEGTLQLQYLLAYKGDPMPAVRQVLQECAALPADSDDPVVLKKRLVGDILTSRLGGGDASKAMAATTQPVPAREAEAVYSALMEYLEVCLETAGTIGQGGFYRLAWRDEVDGSPQFARVFLPYPYDPNRRYALVVSLHGYNARNPTYASDTPAGRHDIFAERWDVIYLMPHGRGNTGYRGIGEADVMRAVALARKTFSVDEDRIYLTGQSMGGGGVWHVGSRHADVFAAVAPIFGGWDYHAEDTADEVATWSPQRQKLSETYSSFAQAENLLHTPVFVLHGDRDEAVDVKNSRYAVRMLQRWGYDLRYHELPGRGHETFFMDDQIVGWFRLHTLQRAPQQVRLRASDLHGANAHWVHAEQQEDPFAFMLVSARITQANIIRLASENVLQIRLSPPRELLDPAKPVKVLWNDALAFDAPLPADGQITLRAPLYTPGRRVKKPMGPKPFAIVVGTTSTDPRMKAMCRTLAEQARESWKEWQHVEPRVFLDTEMTDEQIRTYSLTLYGGPADNAVTARLIQDIPLKIEPQRITLDGQAFDVRDAAVRLVYAHPWNDDRLVTILAGNSADGMFRVNLLTDDGDFAIDDGRIDLQRDVGHLAAWGWFDHNWRLNPKYVTTGNPSLRATLPVRKAPRHITAAVPDKKLSLADLLETSSVGSFATMMRDRNWQGKPLRLAGRTYASGIAVECWDETCKATWDLTGGDWKRLRATLGIELDARPQDIPPPVIKATALVFIVRGDGKELYRSPPFGIDSKPAEIDVDIAGVKALELEVSNNHRDSAASSVNWA
ncbi:MAG: NPCBM/NEW2 domain-containing protein, partial [Phycisphaerae bacterium]|nr:NPCBM/NEW2 domain-containing protein [Phycisphaerae bacterium]